MKSGLFIFIVAVSTTFAAWAKFPVVANDSIAPCSNRMACQADSIAIAADSLPGSKNLKEVVVLANRSGSANTTSYVLGRSALDHHQMINLKDISTLLPGGSTVNPTLTDDSRLALRATTGERGNAAYGTAIEIDGMRLDNNGMADETNGVSTRAISSSNIESVEVISGIPSVEYGDISNGVVKVTSRRGESPWIIEGATNPYTRQISLNKGFTLSRKNEMGK